MSVRDGTKQPFPPTMSGGVTSVSERRRVHVESDAKIYAQRIDDRIGVDVIMHASWMRLRRFSDVGSPYQSPDESPAPRTRGKLPSPPVFSTVALCFLLRFADGVSDLRRSMSCAWPD